ncbi:prenyltransferase [bacterium]|nr:prenyltransferase [bacterium]
MTTEAIVDNRIFKERFRDWLGLIRFPFFSVGIFPFALGTVLAYSQIGKISWLLFLLGEIVVIAILNTTHMLGEVYDYDEDALSAKLEKNQFCGGSGVMQKQIYNPKNVAKAAYFTLFIGILAGAYIVYTTQSLTLLILGILGGIFGVGYSLPPFRWVKRGFGELLILFAYGWLPVGTSYMIQTGKFSIDTLYISIPVALTIFNVILINEIPDHPADKEFGKKTLCVRMGKKAASTIYGGISILNGLSIALLSSFYFKMPIYLNMIYAAMIVLAILLAHQMFTDKWKDRKILEKLCGLSIISNLAITTLMGITLLF